MENSKRIVEVLKTISERRPDIKLASFIHCYASVDDLRFMSDEDLALIFENCSIDTYRHL